MSANAYTSSLRQQQTEDTHARLLSAALELMAEEPEGAFSHEEIARRSGIARRTVYRHFPSRADLLDAVWEEGNRRLDLVRYPETEEDMLAAVEAVFRRMDEHAPLVRGLIHSNAGLEMRRRDHARRAQGMARALANATGHLSEPEKRRVVGLFQALFSGRTWELLRDRAALGDGDVALTVTWAMRTLLASLYAEQARLARSHAAAGPRAAAANKISPKPKPERNHQQ